MGIRRPIDPARLCLKSVRLELVERREGFDKLSPNGVNTSPCRINSCDMKRLFWFGFSFFINVSSSLENGLGGAVEVYQQGVDINFKLMGAA